MTLTTKSIATVCLVIAMVLTAAFALSTPSEDDITLDITLDANDADYSVSPFDEYPCVFIDENGWVNYSTSTERCDELDAEAAKETQEEKDLCDPFKDSPISELPISCYDYYNFEKRI